MMDKPRLLDTFCGAGGCTKGYQRAGFYVVGVDNRPQPHYCGDEFYQADALEFIAEHGWEYDVIHASPPCQKYSVTRSMHNNKHPDLVDVTRVALQSTDKPYVIENVPGSPLVNYLILCGTMFELRVIRHRWFECHPVILMSPGTCCHLGKATGSGSNRYQCAGGTISLADGFEYVTVCGNDYLADEGRMAMDIDWMTKAELSQAIPPAYTEWIGRQLLEMGVTQ
ncbi:MAG: DNA cytosine methyltransferase [Planctomycetota bacterium]|jgi:DNA (cytosine-5)-methyltransferase 1